ncbi:MAG: helix-turn-helix transcriptional regulator [Clostridia bacterium]|nr:helix-turn-helix transcriptional regulator [Clostridia bacterium]
MTLGENIYRYRTQKNWSQGDLAEALDVSRQSISKWENNLAAPDLDKLIKLRTVFDVTLDELVLGIPAPVVQEDPTPAPTVQVSPAAPIVIAQGMPTMRHVFGFALLIFGLIFFLLSIFWGDSLYFSEAVGELSSIMIVLVSLFILTPYNTVVISVCGVVYVAYFVVCLAILKLDSFANDIFLLCASLLLATWFIVCGLHANKTAPKDGN